MEKSKQKEILKNFETWYDWTFFLKLMSDKLLYDSENYIKDGCHESAKSDGKRMKECAELLKKVYKEEYKFDNSGDIERKEDLEKALDIIKDNLFFWWD